VKIDSQKGDKVSREKLRTEIRKEQIAQAALSLIVSHGMRKLSIARVARRVGLVPSAIYRHFKNKDEVLDAALEFIQNRLLDNVKEVYEETTDPMERLRQLLMRHVKLIRENQAIPLVIFSEEIYHGSPERKARVRRIMQGYLDKVGDIVRQGQLEGRIRSEVDPKTVSLMFIGLFQPAAILWHMSDGGFDVTKHTEKAWKVFSKAIEMG
jgi:AcrR family transcriptional regulator